MATSWSERGAWGEVPPLAEDEQQAPSRAVVARRDAVVAPRELRSSRRRLGPPQPAAPKPTGPTKSTRGTVGEERAVALLIAKGLTIVERNFKTKLGELDIVARAPCRDAELGIAQRAPYRGERDSGTLVFVEVRSRADDTHGSALDAITVAKRRQVARIAQQYIQWRRPTFETARFDVIAITGADLVHIVDAWRL